MTNLTQPGFFRQIFEVYLDIGLSYHQAALVNYIHRWNDKGQKCFAAIESIAAELRLPIRTTRRVIDRSIAEEIIIGSSSGKGRARILEVSEAFLCRVEVQLAKQVGNLDTIIEVAKVDTTESDNLFEVATMDTASGHFVTSSGHFVTASGQSGHLSRSISKPISISNDLEVAISTSKLVPGFEFYKELGLVEDKPETTKLPEVNEKARKLAEDAEYLRIKKELLSKAKNEPVDYSDLPE